MASDGRRRGRPQWVAPAALVLVLVPTACGRQPGPPPSLMPGNEALGKEAIARYGCGSCHRVPGVKGANALLAPPLDSFSKRQWIAGRLENTPENLARWLRDPKAIDDRTDMPNLGVTQDEAVNMAAYLEKLE